MRKTVDLVVLLSALTLAGGLAAGSARAAQSLTVAGIFSNQTNYLTVEKAFFEGLGAETGIDLDVNYRPVDQLGVKARDLLTLVGDGTFDVMIVGVPIVAGEHPFLEGVDVAGVSPSPAGVQEGIAAFKPRINDLLESEFSTKLIALWHFAPIELFCNGPVETAADLNGKKVRTFTKSQSLLMRQLGAITVDLNFAEVYTALQRGVVDCALANGSGVNSAKIAEVTTDYIGVGFSQMVAGHFMNLDKWNSFTPEEQARLSLAFDRLEKLMNDRAAEVEADAANCNAGRDPCTLHTKYSMHYIDPSPEFVAEIKAAAAESTVPAWAEACEARMKGCLDIWNESIGQRVGIQAK